MLQQRNATQKFSATLMITSPRWDNFLHLEDKDQDNRPSQSRDEQAYIEKQYQNSTRRSQKDYMVSLKTHTSYTNKTLTTCNDTTAEWSVNSRASWVHLDSTGILALKSFTTSEKDSSTHLAWCSTISFFSLPAWNCGKSDIHYVE